MGKGEKLWERLMDGADLPDEAVPGQTVVEVIGHNRVLIENHQGVIGYGKEQIRVKVPFGEVHICGGCLSLARMSRERLVVYGRIGQIVFHRSR